MVFLVCNVFVLLHDTACKEIGKGKPYPNDHVTKRKKVKHTIFLCVFFIFEPLARFSESHQTVMLSLNLCDRSISLSNNIRIVIRIIDAAMRNTYLGNIYR